MKQFLSQEFINLYSIAGFICKSYDDLLINQNRLVEKIISLPFSTKRCDRSPVIYLDFSKVFDTITHGIILEKLTAHGLDRCTLFWVKNWLNGQAQRMVMNGVASS